MQNITRESQDIGSPKDPTPHNHSSLQRLQQSHLVRSDTSKQIQACAPIPPSAHCSPTIRPNKQVYVQQLLAIPINPINGLPQCSLNKPNRIAPSGRIFPASVPKPRLGSSSLRPSWHPSAQSSSSFWALPWLSLQDPAKTPGVSWCQKAGCRMPHLGGHCLSGWSVWWLPKLGNRVISLSTNPKRV